MLKNTFKLIWDVQSKAIYTMSSMHYLDQHSQILTDEWQHRLICLVFCEEWCKDPGDRHKEVKLRHDERVLPRHSKAVIRCCSGSRELFVCNCIDVLLYLGPYVNGSANHWQILDPAMATER